MPLRQWIRGRSVWTGLGAVLICLAATLCVGAAVRAPCMSPWDTERPPLGCYNDLQMVWGLRDLGAHATPYQGDVHKVERNGEVVVEMGPGQIEYPVLTGVFAWVTARPVINPYRFLELSVLALAPFALITALALQRLSGARALWFAASPQLAVYAFYNWDLLPVAAAAAGLWAWSRNRPAWAGVLLAAGACAKIWPGFVLVPIVLHLLLAHRVRDAVRTVAAALGVVLVAHLPFLLLNARGVLGPYVMQSARTNDRTTNSLWYWLARGADLGLVNLLSAAAVALSWLVVLAVGWRRRTAAGYPVVPVAAAMVIAYVLFGRVDSPQYALWILPFLIVLQVRARWMVLFAVSDLWLYLQWTWLYGSTGATFASAQVARFVVLGLLLVLVMRRPDQPVAPAEIWLRGMIPRPRARTRPAQLSGVRPSGLQMVWALPSGLLPGRKIS